MIFILIMLASAVIGAMIGSSKGNGVPGFFLGLILGPIGLVIVAVMPGDRVECRYCKSKINPEATVCPNCQKNLS